ncbi:MAG: HAD-IIA family hydrolase [Acidimicrobiales bacterium]
MNVHSMEQFASADLWIVDLDGVVWLTGEPIGEPSTAVAELRERGVRVAFATNNSALTIEDLVSRLDRVGIEVDADDLISSAEALASMLEPGQRVSALAEGGVFEALDQRGVDVVLEGPVDAVVVGWSRSFDFTRLAQAASAARACGRLLATNEDPTHPTPEGLMPGSGALLAAVVTASGVRPEIAGKPHGPMVELVRSRLALGTGVSAVLVGDQPATDGWFAHRLGIPFALVTSGVTPEAARDDDNPPIDVRAADLASLVRASTIVANSEGNSACYQQAPRVE